MLKFYILTAFRNLRKHQGYTLLNIMGLALGLVCFGFISVWVRHERSFDRFHQRADRIYRVVGTVKTDAETFEQAITCPPMAEALALDFPEVEAVVRLDKNDAIVRYEDRQFKEEDILFTDPSFFRLFDFSLVAGDPATALAEPYTVVLTESLAKKYFGGEDPLGRSLTMYLYDPGDQGASYTVTGVVKDPPPNSHFQFNLLGSFKTAEVAYPQAAGPTSWFNNFLYTYILLREGADPDHLEAKFLAFAQKHMGKTMDEYQMHYTYTLQRLAGIYLYSDLRYEIGPTGNPDYLLLFPAIGIFILLLAGINYMNLSTARSVDRTQEIGLKKILGARRSQLIVQFLSESLAVALLSLGIAVSLMELLRPVFFQLTGNPSVPLFSSSIWQDMAVATLVVGGLSGLYPALLISASQPLPALHGKAVAMASTGQVRRALVVFQFAISVGLILAVLAFYGQMRYIQEKDLGYDHNRLLVMKVNGYDEVKNNYQAFREDLLRQSGVEGVATANSLIIGGLGNGAIATEDGEGRPVSSNIYRLYVDYDYGPLYGLRVLAGRLFSRDFPADTTGAFVLNQAAVQVFGWGSPLAAIGKPIRIGNQEGRVIGVVDNFHFSSLWESIQPVMLGFRGGNFSSITVRYGHVDPGTVIATVGEVWQRHFPRALFDYRFYEEALSEQYESEQRFGLLFLWFAGLSIIIAALGLVGLSAFGVEKRSREIGIRKVFGASVVQVLLLLNLDFLKLVLTGIVIAVPLAWLAVQRWLDNFAYHLDLNLWVATGAAFAALLTATLAVSYQSFRAAMANPAERLRDE